MKKFLLITVAALITGSAFALSERTAKAFSTKNVDKGEMKSVADKAIAPVAYQLVNRPMKINKPLRGAIWLAFLVAFSDESSR